MNVSDAPSALKQIRKTSWKFQQTFNTPLNNLQPYVAAILSAASPETACVTIEQAVFEPKHWIDLLTRYSLPPRYSKGVSVTAVGAQKMQELLHTAFTDWFDFLFVPTPKPFVINGAGLGASHQTGWTGIVARVFDLFARGSAADWLQVSKHELGARMTREQVAGVQKAG
jgi:hypothetical protein